MLQWAASEHMPITPRGAGTGLAGGAVGEGLVVDFSRHNTSISDFDPEKRTVRVGAGVVLDTLNGYLKPHGLCFGPDVATSSRATLGGMIANNSSGAHVPVYGTTIDHVLSVEAVLADGTVAMFSAEDAPSVEFRAQVDELFHRHASAIRAHLPDTLVKRWPGFGLDRYLSDGRNLARILGGSEGTLAAIVSAELSLAPLPMEKGLCLLFFASVPEAMQASVEILDLNPAAIEHIDRVLFDQTRGQLPFAATRDLLRLDHDPCEAILIVEFFSDVREKLELLSQRPLGLRRMTFTEPREMEMVWNLRKAGLSLLTGCKGATKPVPGIEDAAVPPRKLPEYVNRLIDLMSKKNCLGSFYGHAASGLLHVRPVVDLHTAEDVAKYRLLADEVSALVKEMKGSIAGEHGVGIARTQYIEDHFEPEIMQLHWELKRLFDPGNVMNPGKILADEHAYTIDTHLRWGPGYKLNPPFEPMLAFAAKDASFVGNLEQCNGCGGCRKSPPTMCPTYVATGEEIMSTRGRANVIRAILDGRLDGDLLRLPELDEALSNCLSCKACTTECPSNVNMALLKAEILHARHRKYGVPLRDRMISAIDRMGRWGTLLPGIANAVIKSRIVLSLNKRLFGFAAGRPLPPFATQRFDRWFEKRPAKPGATRGKVVLWDDTFVRYHEPHIGKAAVAVLEAAGFEVNLVRGRQCCGRPAFSVGCLDTARAFGKHNVTLLSESDVPVIFLEPSCFSMFKEDYRELGIRDAVEVSRRCILFEEFIFNAIEREPDILRFKPGYTWAAVHAHCHAKALTPVAVQGKLLNKLPNPDVRMLQTGCCGMAGAFGQYANKYDLSIKVAQPLVDQINQLTAGTEVVASGTSCRHQIDHLTAVKPVHIAELLARNLA
ncbi:MAG: lactate dehydrogenase [Candidatus Hydrogenedentota bacterium]